MDEFMELYMRHIVQILTHEPIDIFARPTYLPINFARHYDQLWTKERVRTIIELASARDIALEIQENTRVPSLPFIQQAKEAGIKFTFGTNARNHNAGNFHYCLEMAEKCSLTEADMFMIEV
jgi:histidinol phosphatase-like PHP family hydrolase